MNEFAFPRARKTGSFSCPPPHSMSALSLLATSTISITMADCAIRAPANRTPTRYISAGGGTVEFGLPLTASDHWGFSGARENSSTGSGRIAVLEPDDYSISPEDNRLDHEMMSWLTRPAGRPDTTAGVLLHAICAAHREQRRLICRISDPALAVTLSGFERVASRFGIANPLQLELAGLARLYSPTFCG